MNKQFYRAAKKVFVDKYVIKRISLVNIAFDTF